MKDTQFLTAVQKETILKNWKAFLKGGCKKSQFTKALYEHLIDHCSFIAHYDLHGFYAEYFHDPVDTMHFFEQFDRASGCRAIELFGNGWLTDERYADINEAMVNEYMNHYRAAFSDRLVREELERARLKAKAANAEVHRLEACVK